jgi:hypothetical protein
LEKIMLATALSNLRKLFSTIRGSSFFIYWFYIIYKATVNIFQTVKLIWQILVFARKTPWRHISSCKLLCKSEHFFSNSMIVWSKRSRYALGTIQQIALTFSITCSFFKVLSKAKDKYPDFEYIDILNSQLQSFLLKFTERLENRLSSKISNYFTSF